MDPVIITAITAPFIGAITILWGFVVQRFKALERSNRECEERYNRLEKRLDQLTGVFR